MKCNILAPLLIALVISTSCQATENSHGTSGKGTTSPAPTVEQLAHATYHGLDRIDRPVTLVDGRWEGDPFVPGAASRPTVHLLRDFRLVGDVNDDDSDEAVVLLGQNSGGSGEFIYLSVVAREDDRIVNLGTSWIGDRVQIRGARIDDGRIALDIVRAGPEDAACCPGELATLEWELTEQGLGAVGVPVVTGRLSLDTIADSEWVLTKWQWDESVDGEPQVTLTFVGERFAGHAGCNRYFASVESGPMPGDLAVGAAATTRMACPETEMAVERRFLKQLAGAKRFGFMTLRLALTYQVDGTLGTMLFDRRPPAATDE